MKNLFNNILLLLILLHLLWRFRATLNLTVIVEEREKEKIYSKRVRAGKRTYFFDVKSTRGNDYYLTITESRRHPQGDGFTYEKHKMFIYKEDFDKFLEALQGTVNHIKNELMPEVDFTQFAQKEEYDDFNSDLKWE